MYVGVLFIASILLAVATGKIYFLLHSRFTSPLRYASTSRILSSKERKGKLQWPILCGSAAAFLAWLGFVTEAVEMMCFGAFATALTIYLGIVLYLQKEELVLTKEGEEEQAKALVEKAKNSGATKDAIVGGLLLLLLIISAKDFNLTLWLDDHPQITTYLIIYLSGCVLTMLLEIVYHLLSGVHFWVTKENVYTRNLSKLESPEVFKVKNMNTLFYLFFTKNGRTNFLNYFLLPIALSWLGFLFELYVFFAFLFGVLRDIFASVPEEIKLLKFPLSNNPDLSREAVWAYVTALDLKAGVPWSHSAIRSRLDYVSCRNPAFDHASALKILDSLKVVDSEAINTVISQIDNPL